MPPTNTPYAVAVRNRTRGQLRHALDARYVRLMTSDLETAARSLCAALDPAEIDCVIGFPEGGIPIAYATARILDRPLVLSTRMPHELADEIRFEEPHNAADVLRNHYIYPLRWGDRVVIAEDEITTGVTIVNAIRALKAAGVVVDDVVVLLAPDDPELLARIEAEGVRVTAHGLVPLEVSRAVAGKRTP